MPKPGLLPIACEAGETPSRQGTVAGWLCLAAGVLAVLAFPAFFHRGAPHKKAFGDAPLRQLEQARPECLFFGDSMLNTRVSEERLQQLAPFRCLVMDRSASGTALWYLMLKNYVAPLEHPPRWLVIFFRDQQLTLPRFRTTGNYARAFDEYRHEAEPLVDDLLRTPDGLLGRALHRLPASWRELLEDNEGFGYTLSWPERVSLSAYPIQERRPEAQRHFSELAVHVVSHGAHSRVLREATNELFGAGRVRRDAPLKDGITPALIDPNALDLNPSDASFAHAVERSFLPPMIDLARQRGIQPIFLRVRRLSELGDDYRDPPGLAEYMRELQDYLTAHGALLIDETHNAKITRDYFLGDDHVVNTRREDFTELVWQELAPLLHVPSRP